MVENSSSTYEEGQGMTAAPTPHLNPLQPTKFSPDELRVLNECNTESFFQRSLPIGTAMGVSTYLAMQKGILKPSPRFGVFPKVSLAVVVGYFVGKLSYQQRCAEKLMALPNSYIGQLLRDRESGARSPPNKSIASPGMYNVTPGDIYSDAGPGSSLNLDTDRPSFSNDDNFTPSNAPIQPDSLKTGGPGTSYEDLRNKNRQQNASQTKDPYKVDPVAPPPVLRQSDPRAKVNKYGDVVD